MKNLKNVLAVGWRRLFFVSLLLPVPALASVESSLQAVQGRLINVVLPLCGVVGLAIAGVSFVLGQENARAKLMLAIVGAIVGFGAPSIIEFIQGLIH